MPRGITLGLLERGAGLGAWAWDSATSQLTASPGWRSLLSVGAEAPLPPLERCLDRFEPGSRERFARALEQCRLHGLSWDLELQLAPRHGGRHLRSVGEACVDAGRIVGMQGVLVDIEARHRAELERDRLQRQCRAISDAFFLFKASVAPDGTLLDVSDSALAMCREPRERLIGRRLWLTPWWTYSGETQMQLHAGIMCAAAGEVVRYEVDIMGLKGPVAVDLRIKPVFDAQGQVETLVAEGQDVSDRRRVADSLRQSEARFRALFDLSPIGLAVVGLDGRIQMVNRALSELIGYSRIQLLAGMNFQQITHAGDLDAEREQVHQMLSGEIRGYRIEKRFIHRSGWPIPVQLDTALVRDDHGEPLYFVLHVQDRAAVQGARLPVHPERRARA